MQVEKLDGIVLLELGGVDAGDQREFVDHHIGREQQPVVDRLGDGLVFDPILVDSRLGLRDVAAQLENLGRRVAGCPGDQVEVGIAGGRLAQRIVEVPFLLLILEIAQLGLHLRYRLLALALRCVVALDLGLVFGKLGLMAGNGGAHGGGLFLISR